LAFKVMSDPFVGRLVFFRFLFISLPHSNRLSATKETTLSTVRPLAQIKFGLKPFYYDLQVVRYPTYIILYCVQSVTVFSTAVQAFAVIGLLTIVAPAVR
jgi:hypothetical protein